MKKLLAVVLAFSTLSVAGPVWAAGPPYTVSVGGSSATATHVLWGATSGIVTMSIKNSFGTVLPVNCSSTTVGGTVQGGTAVNPWAALTTSLWTGCAIPGGPASASSVGSWSVVGTGATATVSVVDTISGSLDGISINLSVTNNPAVCSFKITGNARMRFDESTQRINVSETGHTGSLRVSNVSGCLGQLQNGNAVDLETAFPLSSPDGFVDLS